MYCPNCRLEYEPGITACADCNVKLVKTMPDDPGYVEFVTALETGNPAVLAVAKSVLDDAGIEYFARGETVQNIVGGAFGVGFNVATGPVELQVDSSKLKEAKAVLDHIGEGASSV